MPALAAAIVGGFQSPLIAVIAGIAIGMVQAWLVFLSGRYSWMPKSGLAEIVPLVVMLVALLVTGRAVPVRGTVVRTPLGRAPRPRSLLVPTVVGLAVGAGALILTHGSARVAIITTLIFAIIALSLVVVTGYAGQVSLAQLAIAGVAAFTLSGLTISWGVPFPLAPLVAALVATVVGVLVGLPTLRLRGLTLGVVTLALAFGLEAIWFRNAGIVDAAGAKVVSPKLFGLDLGIGGGRDFPRLPFGFMCLIVCAFVAVGVGRLPYLLPRLGHARRAGQRAVGRRHRHQRDLREGGQLHNPPRSSPASEGHCWPTGRAPPPGRASRPWEAWLSSPPPTSQASRR